MKILFLTREGGRLAGARMRCYGFARELRRYGMETQVFSFADALGAKDGMHEKAMSLRDKIVLNRAAFRVLYKERGVVFYLHRFNYHALAPLLASLFNGNKFILDLDDWEMREDPRYLWGFLPTSKAHYATARLAAKSICCVAASRFLESFLSAFNRRVAYIPTGVDLRMFDAAPDSGNLSPIRYSWIGTFDHPAHVENIAFALTAFLRLRRTFKDSFFEILGEGLYESRVIELVKKSEDSHVILRKWVPFEQVPIYLKDIDVGLFPVARETKYNLAKSPTKLFEYMAMSKPTVVSSVGEAREIIHAEETGLMAPDVDSFARQMERLARDASLRRRLGVAARASAVQSYSAEGLGKKLFDFIGASL
jgi:glycosyltransferase involved in cell wall biosynthesis